MNSIRKFLHAFTCKGQVRGTDLCASTYTLGRVSLRDTRWSLIAACVFVASTLLSLRSDAFCALINFRASPIDLFMKGEALVVSQEVTFYAYCTEICNGIRPKIMCYL